MLPLPITFDLPLPRLYTLPQTVLMAGALGYIYGKLIDVSAVSCAKLFAITQLANSIFFLLVKAYLKLDDKPKSFRLEKQRIILAFTTVITQVIGIVAMRHLNLIAKQGTLLWSLFIMGMLGRQIIQELDQKECFSLNSAFSEEDY